MTLIFKKLSNLKKKNCPILSFLQKQHWKISIACYVFFKYN